MPPIWREEGDETQRGEGKIEREKERGGEKRGDSEERTREGGQVYSIIDYSLFNRPGNPGWETASHAIFGVSILGRTWALQIGGVSEYLVFRVPGVKDNPPSLHAALQSGAMHLCKYYSGVGKS